MRKSFTTLILATIALVALSMFLPSRGAGPAGKHPLELTTITISAPHDFGAMEAAVCSEAGLRAPASAINYMSGNAIVDLYTMLGENHPSGGLWPVTESHTRAHTQPTRAVSFNLKT